MVSKKTKKISKKTLQNMKRMRLYKDKKKFRVYTKKRIKHKNKTKHKNHTQRGGSTFWKRLFGSKKTSGDGKVGQHGAIDDAETRLAAPGPSEGTPEDDDAM